MVVRWKQVMTMLLKGVSQSGTARAARCSKRDVSRAARVIRECSVDSALLASLSDREVAERWFPARPRERAEGYLHPDLDACVECKGAYRRLPLKLLWYEYRDSAGREGLKAHGYQAFRARVRRARGAVGRDRALGARAGRQGVHRLDRRLPASDRSGHWPAHEGAGVRRCAPILGVDLRPGDAGPAHGVMAGGAPEHAGVVRGRAEHARPGPVRGCGRPHAPRVDGDPTPTGGIWNSPGITGPRSCRRAGSSHETRRRCGEAVDLVGQWIVEPSRDETFRTIMDPGRLHRRTGHVAQPPARHSGAGFEAGTVPGPGNDRCCRLASRGAVRPLPVEEGQGARDTAISASST